MPPGLALETVSASDRLRQIWKIHRTRLENMLESLCTHGGVLTD